MKKTASILSGRPALYLSLLVFGLGYLSACGAGTPPPATDAAPPSGGMTQLAPREMPFADPERLRAALAAGEEIYVVDVRTPEEYAAGHIKGASNIPYDQIGAKPPTPDMKAEIVVYCRSGNRSGQAAATLRALGYQRVADMGAFADWKGEVATGSD